MSRTRFVVNAFIAAMLILIACAIALRLFMPRQWNENYLYLTEKRQSIDFDLDDLSESWTEQTLRKRFAHVPIRCYAEDMFWDMERSCTLDVKAINDIPALTISFFFKKKELQAAIIHIPAWRHQKGTDHLLKKYGKPRASSLFLREMQNLRGWKTANGASIIYNSNAYINPINTSVMLWTSATLCKRHRTCIVGNKFG